ncbi:MAG: Agmatine deiminase [Verrucomicrobia subdivision 3 bacterium]|nr:Agmatine deiminase [Limisphaerales bacterium]MCS1416766.1 Agmatine deiminase [Limisphaerales bacterium]
MPAEWAPHQGTWLTWPREAGVSFPGRFPQIYEAYRLLTLHLATNESVYINVWDKEMEQEARSILRLDPSLRERVQFFPHPSYESWCRDHGPIFVLNCQTEIPEKVIIDWDYNAWGNKYPPFDLDNAVPKRIADVRGLKRFQPKMILEGGSIDVNGQGLLLATESCLLNPNRNPHLSRQDIKQALSNYLGITEILWLGDGIIGDDTDGHVDNITRFVSADTAVTVIEPDPLDENYQPLRDNLKRLHAFNKGRVNPLRIVELPMPQPVIQEGIRLPASYANFYIANGLVVVPTFDDPNDAVALKTLQMLIPDRQVVGLDSKDLIWGLGSFHCITQQEPLLERRRDHL